MTTLGGCAKNVMMPGLTLTTDTTCVSRIKPEFKSFLYNAHINVTGKHLSGLLLLKTMEDGKKRAVFTNEMGVTFFDFEFAGASFKAHQVIRQLDRKVVVSQLREDIGLLLMEGIDFGRSWGGIIDGEHYSGFDHGKEQFYYITDSACTELTRIESRAGDKKKIIISLTGKKSGMADSVYIDHQGFEFNISLKQIESNAQGTFLYRPLHIKE